MIFLRIGMLLTGIVLVKRINNKRLYLFAGFLILNDDSVVPYRWKIRCYCTAPVLQYRLINPWHRQVLWPGIYNNYSQAIVPAIGVSFK